MSDFTSDEEIMGTINSLIAKGQLKIVGVSPTGDTEIEITETGKKVVFEHCPELLNEEN